MNDASTPEEVGRRRARGFLEFLVYSEGDERFDSVTLRGLDLSSVRCTRLGQVEVELPVAARHLNRCGHCLPAS